MATTHPTSALKAGKSPSALVNDQADPSNQADEKYIHIAARLLNDEVVRSEFTRDFFEQNSIFDHEAPFEEIFGPYNEYESINKSFEVEATIEDHVERFVQAVHTNASPWERFLTMDPVNEPCYLYGKQQLSMHGLKLGDATSATFRALASIAVAAQSNRDYH